MNAAFFVKKRFREKKKMKLVLLEIKKFATKTVIFAATWFLIYAAHRTINPKLFSWILALIVVVVYDDYKLRKGIKRK